MEMFTNKLSTPEKNFEEIYIAARESESRIYTDEQVSRLPIIDPKHLHYNEWQVRRRSSERLKNYLQKKKHPLSILEMGCGNGWLSARLSAVKDSTVTGMDINKTELAQAVRVFSGLPNISFKEGGIKEVPTDRKFDTIVFAASIQYFQPFEWIVLDALNLLSDSGEIHILDSHFYYPAELESAKERSRAYYQSTGFEEMSGFYFHHSYDSLKIFDHTIMFNPDSFTGKLFWKNDPFPWIRIKASTT
jgi:ubiquinone/menaquinone biosynthesis C-methylase UbiE